MTDTTPTAEQRNPGTWVPTLYFTQGFPYTTVMEMATVFFTALGVPLVALGMFQGVFGLPWAFKFIWSPLVELFGTKRGWILALQGLLVAAFVILAAVVGMPHNEHMMSFRIFVLNTTDVWAKWSNAGFSLGVLLLLFAVGFGMDPRRSAAVRGVWFVLGVAVIALLTVYRGKIFTADTLELSISIWLAFAVFLVAAFLSATHDIAIDGFYLDSLDPAGQASFSGVRVMFYRIAMVMGGGLLVMAAGSIGWFAAFAIGAGLFFLIYLWHIGGVAARLTQIVFSLLFIALFLDYIISFVGTIALLAALLVKSVSGSSSAIITAIQGEGLLKRLVMDGGYGIGFLVIIYLYVKHRQATIDILKQYLIAPPAGLPRRSAAEVEKAAAARKSFSQAFSTYLDQKRIVIIVLFILLYRLGDFLWKPMSKPFLMAIGVSVTQIGFLQGVLGIIATILGSILGGVYIAKRGLTRGLWVLGIVQSVTLLLYAWLALVHKPLPAGQVIELPGLIHVGAINCFENFAYGLGTIAFVNFLMRTCKKEYNAAHYAIATGLMALATMFAGFISGFIAQKVGFMHFFVLCFVSSIPGLAILYFLPLKELEPAKA